MSFLKLFKKVRTRIAPSPTGTLHIGTARTALFNYIFAIQNKGDFVLRIEDTDKQRSDKRFEQDILDGLEWLNIKYNEFYRQSERNETYRKYLKKLLKKGDAFFCYHTKEELHAEKTRQMQNKEAPRHICEHKNIKPKTQSGSIIRLKGTDKKIKFQDMIRGEIEYNGSLLGDLAIAKNENTPLYNFAVVIDDHEMKISHIIRGEDHIPNTPKQILIQEALNIKRPFYAHIPLILGADKSKLSKRHGATSVNEYKRTGYLPEAMINFMALLGWNPGDNRELMNKKELFNIFSIKKIQKGGAVFDIEKLNWFNKEHIKKMPTNELSQEIEKYIPKDWKEKTKKDKKYWEKIIDLEKERLVKLSDIGKGIEFFFVKPNFPKSLLVWKQGDLDSTKQHLDKIYEILSTLKESKFKQEKIKEVVWNYAEERGRGNVLWPFRVALTGLAKSPEPFTVASILGKKETLERLDYARNMIFGNPSYS
ncbi:glutamate--tRNA ligase [Patescibacteria group bacterium]